MSRSTRRAPEAQPSQADGADLTANAPASAAAQVGRGDDIPAPPPSRPAQEGEQAIAGDPASVLQGGATLNPSDPTAPNFRFEPAADADNLAGDQTIDQGTSVQPPSPVLATAGGDGEAAAPDAVWTDEVTPRGRVISVTKGGAATTTREEVLPHGATDQQAAGAKSRLLAWLMR